MNEVQKTELEILKAFIAACEALRLPYFLVCGSCLGAVKYQGFIPWDDDIDVGMLRGDYERFLEKAPALLPEHLFLQHYKSEKQVPFLYAKLRDSRTTCLEASYRRLPIHQGIYIDIFPLDGYPDKHTWWFERKKSFYKLHNLCAYDVRGRAATQCFLKAERILGCHKRTYRANQKLEQLLSRVPPEQSAVWCNHGNWQGKREYAPKSQYGEGALATFEDLTVRIPSDYDAYLTQKYGDWRADLPPERQISHHNVLVCDTKRSFENYL